MYPLIRHPVEKCTTIVIPIFILLLCLIFIVAIGYWNNTTNELIASWGGQSKCNFMLFMGIVTFLASIYFFFRTIFLLCKGYDSSPLFSFISLLIGTFVTISLFVCSCIVSIGYSSWCDIVISKRDNEFVCWKVDLGDFDKKYDINSADFSSNFEIVEFGSWSSGLAWFAATVLSFCKVRYYHKNEEFLQDLAFEKDTLIPYRQRYQKIDGESSLS